MVVIKRVDAMDWARAYALAAAIVVFLIGTPILVVTALVGFANQGDSSALAVAAVLATLAMSVIVIWLTAFVVAWFQAILVNWALGRTGGVKVELAEVKQNQG